MPRHQECFYLLPADMLVRWNGKRLMFAKTQEPSLKAYLKSEEVRFLPRARLSEEGGMETYIPGPGPITSEGELFDAVQRLADKYGEERVTRVERVPYVPGVLKWRA